MERLMKVPNGRYKGWSGDVDRGSGRCQCCPLWYERIAYRNMKTNDGDIFRMSECHILYRSNGVPNAFVMMLLP